jgi:hypothetical protein
MRCRWSILLVCLVAAACAGDDSQAGDREADEISTATREGWHVVFLPRVNPPPGAVEARGRIPEDVVVLGGTAAAPTLQIWFDNPCGRNVRFAYRIGQPGEVDVRVLGMFARSEVCTAQVQMEMHRAAILPLTPGRWHIVMRDTSMVSAGPPVTLR